MIIHKYIKLIYLSFKKKQFILKIKLLVVGKTDDKRIKLLIDDYTNRLKHYISFEIEIIPDIKNSKKLSVDKQKTKEGEIILSKHLNSGVKQVIFVVGGPYGFSTDVYNKAQGKISLSQMTFSHQMIRLFFTEQIYRAFTILKNEPYHHE